MPNHSRRPHWDAFVSHTSADDALADRAREHLTRLGVSVWVDHHDLSRQGLLLEALQAVIERSRHVVLLWSKLSARSRYVTAEWNFAWNREVPIVPCRVDQTRLPLGLAGALFCDFRSSFEAGIQQLADALQAHRLIAQPSDGAAAPPARKRFASGRAAVDRIAEGQDALLAALGSGQTQRAARLQARLDPMVDAARRQFPRDADVLNLAAYHLKNAYQLKHWDAIQAGQRPADPLLAKIEAKFWEVLKVRPNDASALNGIGNVLWFRGDLDAAEFYTRRSIERAKLEHLSYPYAEHDLTMIRREKAGRSRS